MINTSKVGTESGWETSWLHAQCTENIRAKKMPHSFLRTSMLFLIFFLIVRFRQVVIGGSIFRFLGTFIASSESASSCLVSVHPTGFFLFPVQPNPEVVSKDANCFVFFSRGISLATEFSLKSNQQCVTRIRKWPLGGESCATISHRLCPSSE